VHPPTRLPIIMLTGRDARDDVVEALRRGANDYITKPLDMAVVIARLRTQLSLKSAVDQIVGLERDLERKNAELERANDDLRAAYRRMKSDLQAAARVQRSLLPSSPPPAPGLTFAWRYHPCQELAGDSLNVFTLDDEHIGCYLLDVTGHGVPAALLSVTITKLLMPVPDQPSLVRRREPSGRLAAVSPRVVAEELNARFQLDPETCRFFTLFYGLLNTRTREVRYVCAGQSGPVLARAGEVRNLNQPEIAIGVVPDPGYHERRLQLMPGDRLYVYSDGIDEARDARRTLFGEQRAMRVIRECRDQSLDASLDRLVHAAEQWAAAALDDDVSALALELLRD
ncbi:MAG: response regulator, partial [Planctomycetota bacterium]